MTAHAESSPRHLAVLDGWRGLSILFVMAAHLLPLGPPRWQLNQMSGPVGMALFFTLSGFLITSFLLTHTSVIDFLVRRLCRILPLAWLAMAIALPLAGTAAADYLPNFLFYANLPPQHLTEVASHFWSLCVEMQFYIGVALLVATVGQRGLYALPLVCLAVTLHRIAMGAQVDIVTWRRIDEILAGATLALVYAGKFGPRPLAALRSLNSYALLALLLLASHPATGALNYVRPYIAAALVGTTLVNPPARLGAVLRSRFLAYMAAISYALYVVHHLLIYTWLGEGDKWIKYLKRPLLFAASFALAHASTFYFEAHCIRFGKHLAGRLGGRKAACAPD